MEDRPKRIKMNLFPADRVDVEKGLAELAKHGFITRYVVDGERFIEVPNFVKHQNPHIREAESTIPAPCEHGARHCQDSLNPDSLQSDSLIESVGEPLREIYIGTVTAELAKRMDLKTLPAKLEWQREAEWSAHNGFTSDQFLEAYDLLKQQKWRDGPVKPKHVTEHLPQLAKLRKEIEKQKNGTSQQHQRPHRETTRDRLAATAASLSKYPTEAELAELREDGGNANRSG